MTFSTRRALGVAVVATAAGVAQVTAQGSPPPQVTVGGVVYTQYVYQLKDTLNHVNTFDITRAYVNVIGRFSGGVGTRVTGDIYRNPNDSSLSYRLKYAFATYTPQGSPLTFKVGQIHTPWLDWEEALWDYRVQGCSGARLRPDARYRRFEPGRRTAHHGVRRVRPSPDRRPQPLHRHDLLPVEADYARRRSGRDPGRSARRRERARVQRVRRLQVPPDQGRGDRACRRHA